MKANLARWCPVVESTEGQLDRDPAELARGRLLERLAPAMTGQQVADLAVKSVPELVGAEGAVIFLCDEQDHLELVAYLAPLAHRDLLESAGAGWIKLAPDALVPAAEVVASGISRIWMDPNGKGSVETLPLRSDDQVFGAIALVFTQDSSTKAAGLSSDEAIQVVSESLARTAIYEREATSAGEYVRSTRPRYLPNIPGLEFGVAIPSPTNNLAESGHWFNVSQPQHSRALVAMGCVGGGKASYSVAASVRSALLAYSVISQRPDELLDMLIAFHRTQTELEGIPDVGIARFDVDLDHFSWATSGNVSPLLYRSGKTRFLGRPGDGTTSGEVTLGPGDVVLMADACRLVDNDDENLGKELAALGELPPAQLAGRLLESRSTRGIEHGGFLAFRVGADSRARAWVVEATPTEIAAGRKQTRRELSHLGVEVPATVDDAELIMSELLSNVVRHVGGSAWVSIQRLPDRLRLEVADSGTEETLEMPTTDVLDDKGRGLFLIDSVAHEWGVLPSPEGKTVWAELELPASVDERVGED